MPPTTLNTIVVKVIAISYVIFTETITRLRFIDVVWNWDEQISDTANAYFVTS